MPRRKAFTLIEILIVIVIIAVMACVVVPAYVRYLGHIRFRGTTRQVQDLFAYAREQALAHDDTVTLHYDPQSESFSVDVPQPASMTDLPVSMSTGDSAENTNSQVAPIPRTVQLSHDQRVMQYTVTPPTTNGSGQPAPTQQGGQNDLHFQSDGTVEGMEMELGQSDGVQVHLTLSPATGRLTQDTGVTR